MQISAKTKFNITLSWHFSWLNINFSEFRIIWINFILLSFFDYWITCNNLFCKLFCLLLLSKSDFTFTNFSHFCSILCKEWRYGRSWSCLFPIWSIFGNYGLGLITVILQKNLFNRFLWHNHSFYLFRNFGFRLIFKWTINIQVFNYFVSRR